MYGLLLYPDHDDPLDSTLTLQMYDSNGEYEAAIIEHVKAHARRDNVSLQTAVYFVGCCRSSAMHDFTAQSNNNVLGIVQSSRSRAPIHSGYFLGNNLLCGGECVGFFFTVINIVFRSRCVIALRCMIALSRVSRCFLHV